MRKNCRKCLGNKKIHQYMISYYTKLPFILTLFIDIIIAIKREEYGTAMFKTE